MLFKSKVLKLTILTVLLFSIFYIIYFVTDKKDALAKIDTKQIDEDF